MKRSILMLLWLISDIIIVLSTPWIGLSLRFDEGIIPEVFFRNYEVSIAVTCGIHIVSFYFLGLYRRLWQYASIHELLSIVCAVSLGSLLSVVYTFFINCMLPRSVYFFSWILNIGIIGASRLLVRIYYYFRCRTQQDNAETAVLIVGAGDAGAVIARELKGQSLEKKKLIGFVDDSDFKKRQSLFGVPVLGGTDELVRIVDENKIDEIIIAMPSVGGKTIREISQKCKQTNCRVQVVPGLYELIGGEVSLSQLRDLNLEDLLRRDPVLLETESLQRFLKGKRILVTGAGGSIGSELCRQIVKFSPAEIVLLGKGENSIYEIDLELKMRYGSIPIEPVIADVRDENRIYKIFKKYKPHVVFHAAAHKHVPLMEIQPEEAVLNNVFGTKVVAGAAVANGVDSFILISTDKAVNPTSVMGATKRVAELVIRSLNGNGTKLAAVRFGNVLGSRGSVVPLFQKQIAQGGPITITDPEMKRYFMTIPEAAQLVLQAGAFAEGGEVFVLDMGEPVKIVDMAKDLIKLSGLEPVRDIDIQFCGIRPGEKLFEELLTAEEGTRATLHEKIFVANLKKEDVSSLRKKFNELVEAQDATEIVTILSEIIKSYNPNRE